MFGSTRTEAGGGSNEFVENLEAIKRIDSPWSVSQREAFFGKLTGLFKTYGIPARDFDIKRYWLEAVDSFPFESVMDSLRNITRQKIYGSPTPDLLVVDLQGGDVKEMARKAWAEILYAIQRFGPYESVVFSSEQVASMVRKIGWAKLCALSGYELEQLSKDAFVYFSLGVDGRGSKVIGLSDSSRITLQLPLRDERNVKVIGAGG